MKIATLIVRLLMGLLFLYASVAFLLHLGPQPELVGKTLTVMQGFVATGYLLHFIKITELVCSIAFLSGRYVPLATVVIFPITLNILLFHLFVEPSGVVMGILILAGNLFLAFACRQHYRGLFSSRI